MANQPALEQRTTASAKRRSYAYRIWEFRVVKNLFIAGLIIMVLPCWLGWLLSPLIILGLIGIGFVSSAMALSTFMTAPQRRDPGPRLVRIQLESNDH